MPALNAEARRLCDGGAELILLASNTMHKLADQMMQGVDAPLLHIADVTARAVAARGCISPAFIATGFTMEERFYLDRHEGQGLRPLVPDAEQRRDINRIIFDELCRNEVVPASRERYIAVVRNLAMNGADSVILGCTEVCLLLDEANTDLPPRRGWHVSHAKNTNFSIPICALLTRAALPLPRCRPFGSYSLYQNWQMDEIWT